jgi:hypothetical protein
MIDLDSMSDDDKLAALESIHKSIAESKEVQKQKIAANVDLVLQALKKMESDIRARYDETGKAIEKRVANIKDGRDGRNGIDGKDGKDGKSGRDGLQGARGIDGLNGINGIDGQDGVSVVNANIDFDGSLIITLSDGRELNVGEVVSQELAQKIQVISTMSTNGAVGISDEGSSISTGVKNINFVGATVTATNSGDDVTVNVSAGTGTVTSVAVSGGTTGLTTSGGPITTTGTITLAGTLAVASGGTGTATPSLVAGTNITSITGSWPNQTINAGGGSGTVTSVAATVPAFLSVTGSPITTSGTLAIGLSGSALPVANGGTGVTSSTGTTNVVLSNSPVLVTPDLGTPSALVGTNITGTATAFTASNVTTNANLTGAVTSIGNATSLGSFTSAQLLGALTDETGTGAAVFATSPTLVTPALGTPASGVVTNLTGTASININGTVGATTANTGAFTTLTASSTLTVTGAGSIQGLTVGRGAGAVSTNTAVGAAALNNGSLSGGENVGLGYNSAQGLTTGVRNTILGSQSGQNLTTGSDNILIGYRTVYNATSTGSNNVAVGSQSLYSNTTASNNTAVGYQAGYSNTTGIESVYIGQGSGYSATTNGQNTFVGRNSGYSTTGGFNNFFGYGAGNAITTGTKNTIVGRYDGNFGGLDIRTASNHIVLSDGDGNPRGIFDSSGNLLVGLTSVFNGTNSPLQVSNSANNQVLSIRNTNGTPYGQYINYSAAAPNNTSSEFIYCNDTGGLRMSARSNGGIANYSANNVNLSDRREKTNFAPATSYLDKICAIPVQTFNYIDQNLEEDGGLTLGVIAQDVQAVAPEMVMESNWGTEEEPKMRLSIYQTDLQYALMKCIQELKAEFDAYKASHP